MKLRFSSGPTLSREGEQRLELGQPKIQNHRPNHFVVGHVATELVATETPGRGFESRLAADQTRRDDAKEIPLI